MGRFRTILVCAWALAALLATATAPATARTIDFRGRAVAVPAGWPVYRLAEHPRMCVRLDRRAVYVGTPSAAQHCPAHVIGRRRAILIDSQTPSRATQRRPAVRLRLRASASAGVGTPGSGSGSGAFAGLGFDACAAPSTRAMSAWLASPYRAIGVYIGGLNRGCSQPNLTTAWVGTEVAAGWYLIPIYVGLQAPTSGCSSCAKIVAGKATAQGAAAANDAVTHAQSVGMGAGSPIYFDMEGYSRTSKASSATLTFLAAWTSRLHALGYRSGVYGSSASTIADLAGQIGFGYQLPDDIWTANWNGRADTVDPYVPNSAWSRHQRLHQFRGGHNETYGGVRINIDSNYVDGATVGTPPGPRPLTVAAVHAVGGTVLAQVHCARPSDAACPGQIFLRTHVRVRVRVRHRRVRTRVIRVAIAHRGFELAGGRDHTYRVRLNARGRFLLRKHGRLSAQLVVATPGARVFRRVRLTAGG